MFGPENVHIIEDLQMSNLNEAKISGEELKQELLNFFENDNALLEEWLDLRLPILGGELPRNMFDTLERRQRLFTIIQVMKNGDFA